LKYNIGIWVQSRKEDQILRLDLNPYWVIFKLLTFSRWLWDPGLQVRDWVLTRALGAVLRDIRGASPHQYSEAGRWLWLIGYWVFVFFFGLYLRDFATHFDGVSPAGVWHCTLLYILDCYCFVLLLLFCLFWDLSYFIHLTFRTHISSCVRGGIKHP
jgi:hypothetical protein